MLSKKMPLLWKKCMLMPSKQRVKLKSSGLVFHFMRIIKLISSLFDVDEGFVDFSGPDHFIQTVVGWSQLKRFVVKSLLPGPECLINELFKVLLIGENYQRG